MGEFLWITEGIPAALPSSAGGASGIYRVTVEDFDIAIGNLPFMLDLHPEHPYERSTAQWRKDQFDSQELVGEQSLTGWWLRSQSAFYGGAGIEYYEPLQGDGSETRFRSSNGVEVFNDDGSINLLPATAVEVPATASSVEIVAGPTRLLQREGTGLSVWNGTTETAVTGTTTAVSLAYNGTVFLVGDNGNIYTLAENTGTALTALWTGAGADVKVFWAKNRIFAGVNNKLFELTMAGGVFPGTPLITHPSTSWQWTSVTETGGAVWAAGFAGEQSEVHVIAIDSTGATPTLTGGVVGIQLPTTELVNAMKGYLNFLLIGTTAGFRVALTDGATAGLGPLIWKDEPVYSVTGRGDYAYVGCASGLTRKVDLGNEAAGDLGFAYANHLEGGAGTVLSIAWFGGEEHFAVASEGTYKEHSTDLVSSGTLVGGWIRYGTVEGKYFDTARISADSTGGTSINILHQHDTHASTSLGSIGDLDGYTDMALHHDTPAERFSITFQLIRSTTDNTLGPTLNNYQIRALPAPSRRQRLIRFPVLMYDYQRNRQGVQSGNEGFAFARLREIEALERSGAPITMQDFRTGEARRISVEQVTMETAESPDGGYDNFGGLANILVRTLD